MSVQDEHDHCLAAPLLSEADGACLTDARPTVPRRAFGGRLAALAGFVGFLPKPSPAANEERFLVYYSDQAPATALLPYRWLVLDGQHHPPLAPAIAAGATVFGYLSAGESESNRGTYAAARAAGLLLDENPNWPGSFYADVRRPEWHRLVLEEMVPALLSQGFHGVFLDTLDNPPFLETREPARFAGMTAAAAELVRSIRRRFPATKIMLNRAYEIHGAVAGVLDAVLAENVYGGYDFVNRRYRPTSEADARWQLDKLAELKRVSPAIRTFTLDYWNPDDHAGLRRLYARQRRNGHLPYVATIDLHRIVPEPGR
ncbi:endo alpha-1,4 polygalactosaminidase [Muricoccus radiodurans]|uniref:endo alpha-1,4 polygalactosaminidase n=1 Tax=Muricoccus radiodurans TaxID=2231721 RepID=UPI003CF2D068